MKEISYFIKIFTGALINGILISCLSLEKEFEFKQISAISGLDCSKGRLSGELMVDIETQGVTLKIPYSFGNGLSHDGFSIKSSSVEGLILDLPAGKFSDKADSLDFKVLGKPLQSGKANFLIVVGNDSCLVTLEVRPKIARVEALLCNEVAHQGQLLAFNVSEKINTIIPYVKGNGGNFSELNFPSSGVLGLIARIEAGKLNVGDGNIILTFQGVPDKVGVATFEVIFGNLKCTITRTVNLPPAKISGLNCATFKLNKPLWVDNDVSQDNYFEVSYDGGNSGNYDSQTISSELVKGVTAYIPLGMLSLGQGNLKYQLSGKPTSIGFAKITLTMGGKSCDVSIPVSQIPKNSCGAYIKPGVWKQFKCHNLGADENADPFSPSWRLIGNQYKWGRKYWEGRAPDGPDSINANGERSKEWTNNIAGSGAWEDFKKTFNDPCPDGFRVPTKEIWEGVIKNNEVRYVGWGNWFSWVFDYRSGIQIGDKLFLPAAGVRGWEGEISYRGFLGNYWSSTQDESGNPNSYYLTFDGTNTILRIAYKGYGYPIRCMAE
jgi:uncharacterized protein (TIGR02145 family)